MVPRRRSLVPLLSPSPVVVVVAAARAPFSVQPLLLIEILPSCPSSPSRSSSGSQRHRPRELAPPGRRGRGQRRGEGGVEGLELCPLGVDALLRQAFQNPQRGGGAGGAIRVPRRLRRRGDGAGGGGGEARREAGEPDCEVPLRRGGEGRRGGRGRGRGGGRRRRAGRCRSPRSRSGSCRSCCCCGRFGGFRCRGGLSELRRRGRGRVPGPPGLFGEGGGSDPRRRGGRRRGRERVLLLLLLVRLRRGSIRGGGGSPAGWQGEDPLEPLLGGVGAGADEAAGGAALEEERVEECFFWGGRRKGEKKGEKSRIDGIVVVVSLLLLTLSALAESPAAPSGRRQSLPCPEPGVWSGRASAARTPRTRRAARYRSWFLEYEIFFSFFFQFF